MKEKLRILTVNHSDNVGGVALMARNMFLRFEAQGHDSRFLVQDKSNDHEKIITINNEEHWSGWKKVITKFQRDILTRIGSKKGVWKTFKLLDWVADPVSKIRFELGVEEFDYPGTKIFFRSNAFKPDIVHLHLPRAGFFDLQYLPELSNNYPVVFTLHGAWLLSGHCVHSFDCDRWKTGCGKCPDLTIPSSIKRDSSAYNWKRKSKIYSQSKLYIAAPCHWMIDKVKQSMLNQASVEARVIPHGVDQTIFYPDDRSQARNILTLQEDQFIFLFSANSVQRNRWKDFDMMKNALSIVSEMHPEKKILFLAMGTKTDSDSIVTGNTEIRFVPYNSDPKIVADYYRASDVYLHASKADTFPTTILEALSCGIPVIGTAVGGIPEQIRGWKKAGFLTSSYNIFDEAKATGILTDKGDFESFAKAMTLVMNSDDNRIQLGKNAAIDAIERFKIDKLINSYLEWYYEILKKQKGA